MNGRYAPSPTGDLHIGNLRTGLLAFARREDSTSTCGWKTLMTGRGKSFTRGNSMTWPVGIDWDGDVLYQSIRVIGHGDFRDLLDRGLFECYRTRQPRSRISPASAAGILPGHVPKSDSIERAAGRAKLTGMNRGPAYRLKTNAGALTVIDRIAGHYGVVDDFVIRRGDGTYSYNCVRGRRWRL